MGVSFHTWVPLFCLLYNHITLQFIHQTNYRTHIAINRYVETVIPRYLGVSFTGQHKLLTFFHNQFEVLVDTQWWLQVQISWNIDILFVFVNNLY